MDSSISQWSVFRKVHSLLHGVGVCTPFICSATIRIGRGRKNKIKAQTWNWTRFAWSKAEWICNPQSHRFFPNEHYTKLCHYHNCRSSQNEQRLPPDTGSLLRDCLRLIYLLEVHVPRLIKNVPVHAKIARVICTFLLGEWITSARVVLGRLVA